MCVRSTSAITHRGHNAGARAHRVYIRKRESTDNARKARSELAASLHGGGSKVSWSEGKRFKGARMMVAFHLRPPASRHPGRLGCGFRPRPRRRRPSSTASTDAAQKNDKESVNLLI